MNKQEFHMFCTKEAEEFSIESAILLNNLRFWLRKNKANSKNIHEGKVWTYNSSQAFSKLFPYMSASTIWRKLDELTKSGKLLKGNFNDDKRDKTLWFCINEPEFTSIQIDEQHDFKLTNSISQNEISTSQNELPISQNEPPLPYSKPYINTDNKTTPISPKKQKPIAEGIGFVYSNQNSSTPNLPVYGKLLDQGAANTYNRYYEAVAKGKTGMSLYDDTFTEDFTLELNINGNKRILNGLASPNPNVPQQEFDRIYKIAEFLAEHNLPVFNFYLGFIITNKKAIFKNYFNHDKTN